MVLLSEKGAHGVSARSACSAELALLATALSPQRSQGDDVIQAIPNRITDMTHTHQQTNGEPKAES